VIASIGDAILRSGWSFAAKSKTLPTHTSGGKHLKFKRTVIGCSTLFTILIVYHFASAIMVARVVLPAQASTHEVLTSIIKPSYKMVTPHRTLLGEIRSSIFGTAYACGDTNVCDGTKAVNLCWDGCPPNFCQCPNCTQSGGCTPSTCIQTQIFKTLCNSKMGTTPCTMCPNDNNVKCTPQLTPQ
jgi:hypothetical protein